MAESRHRQAASWTLLLACGALALPSGGHGSPAARAAQGRGEAIDLLAQGAAAEEGGNQAAAVEFYRRSVESAPSPAGYYRLGHAALAGGDKATARANFQRALDLNPGYELAKSELASLSGRGGAGPRSAAAGGRVAARVVDVADASGPGSPAALAARAEAFAGGPINVDAMRRESDTLRSLPRPTGNGGVGEATPEPTVAGRTSGSPSLFPFFSRPPVRPLAGAPPAVPLAVARPTPPGAVRAALMPNAPSLISNDRSQGRVLQPGVGSQGSVRDSRFGSADAPADASAGKQILDGTRPAVIAADAPRGARATPEPSSGSDAARSDAPTLRTAASVPGGSGRSASSPRPLRPATPPGGGDPRLTPGDGSEGGGAGSTKSPAGGAPSASLDEINAAAFGPGSDKQKPSIGYGQPGKVALGTFAFHRDRADRYRSQDRFKDAAAEYEYALRVEPGDVETRTLLAEMLGRAGEAPGAMRQFAKAQAIDPSDPRAFYKEGNAYRDAGKLDMAIGSYLKALSLDPDDKFTLNNLGVAYLEKGEYAKAAARFKRVIDVDPKYGNALLNLGILYDDHLGDKALAVQYYDRYLATGEEARRGEVQRWVEALRRGGDAVGAAPEKR